MTNTDKRIYATIPGHANRTIIDFKIVDHVVEDTPDTFPLMYHSLEISFSERTDNSVTTTINISTENIEAAVFQLRKAILDLSDLAGKKVMDINNMKQAYDLLKQNNIKT